MRLILDKKLVLVFIFLQVGRSWSQTQCMSLSFSSRILEKGKFVTAQGEVYYNKSGGVLTTHLTKPFESISIVNVNGEMKIYDFLENTLIQSQSEVTSSESSYFRHFFSGNYNDLGIKAAGYNISGTKTEDGMLVSTWKIKEGLATEVPSIVIVHEKSLPIYMEYIGFKQCMGKVYFSDYQKVGQTNIPFKITEIGYKNKGDSILVDKTYSSPKINSEVDRKYLDFKIPQNAKLVQPK